MADRTRAAEGTASHHIHSSANATLAVDDLAAATGFHAGAESELADSLDSTGTAWVMHG